MKSYYIKVIILQSLFFKYSSKCTQGCLKCTPDDECLICDANNFYAFNEKTSECEKKSITNCVSLSYDGKCQLCDSSSFIDDGECSEVSNTIQNCQIWASEITCSLCSSNFALQNLGCVSAISIANCAYHLNQTNYCYECQKGSIKTIDEKFCTVVNQTTGCIGYSFLDCAICKDGYSFTRNSYLYDIINELEDDTSQFIKTKILNDLIFSKKGSSKWGVCKQIEILNCEFYTNYNECSQCSEGYFLNSDKQCTQNPQEGILYCVEYESESICSKCENGYYLIQSTCTVQPIIDNCQIYSQSVHNFCDQCIEGFYSKGSTCQQRQNLIEKCQNLKNNDDICQECQQGYEINSDGKQCLEGINFCEQYQKTSTTLSCQKCQNKYFLNGTICEQGEIYKCDVYQSETICSICENGYFLNDIHTCSENQLMNYLNCTESLSDKINYCVNCDQLSVLIEITGICREVSQKISNCDIYSNDTTCGSCKQQYTYLEDGICILGNIDQCSLYDDSSNICLQCQINEDNKVFIPYPQNSLNNSCVMADPNLTQNCKQISLNLNQVSCLECQTLYYPLRFPSKYTYQCVPRDFYAVNNNIDLDYCIVFNHLTNKCSRCQSNKVISSYGTCEDSCQSGQLVKLFTSLESDDSYIKNYKQCEDRTSNIISSNLFDPNSPNLCSVIIKYAPDTIAYNFCISCSKNQVGTIQKGQQGINVDYQPYSNKNYVSHWLQVPPIFSCISKDISSTQQTTSSITLIATFIDDKGFEQLGSLENCKYASKLAGDRYGCVSCKLGYSGQIKQIANLQTYGIASENQLELGYFIPKCEIIDNCVSSIYYKGIGIGEFQTEVTEKHPYNLSFFISCHKCNDNQIPTYGKTVYEANTIFTHSSIFPFGFTTYKTADGSYPKDYESKENQTSCKEIGLGLSFVANCAIQEVAINKPIQITTSNQLSNPRCVACSPGYTPVWSSLNSSTQIDSFSYISQCQLITNCDTSQTFSIGKCDICRGIYSLKYDPQESILSKKTECIISNQISCLIYDQVNERCVVCEEGFVLNQDWKCDKVNLQGCDSVGFFIEIQQEFFDQNFIFGTGCLECQADQIAVFFDSRQTQCILSSDLKSGDSITNSNFLIENCSTYGQGDIADQIICISCNTGYMINISGSKCFLENSNFQNCQKYNENGSGCAQCDEKYFLNNQNLCILRQISQCLVYENEKKCLKCNQGYIPIRSSNNRYLCYQKPQFNCSQYSSNSLENSIIECSKCDRNYFYDISTELGIFPLNFCLQIPEIENCVAYDNMPNIKTASIECIECSPSYFLEDNICQQRQNLIIENCLLFSKTGDFCSICKEGFYSDQQKGCVIFPQGISNCEVYEDLETCLICKSQYYLKNNSCHIVPNENQIINCISYSSLTSCSQCEEGYFQKSETECIKSTANNCKTYVDVNNCKSCEVGYGLIIISTGVECQKINIQNCEVINQTMVNGQYVCEKCIYSFYVNSLGSCTAVTVPIANCGYYSNATTCSQCLDGYILTKDYKQCSSSSSLMQFADPNCKNPIEQQIPICNTCQAGYFFDENSQCISCSSITGCLVCDLQQSEKCLICKSGYYMNSSQDCLVSGTTDSTIVQSSNDCVLKVLLFLLILF